MKTSCLLLAGVAACAFVVHAEQRCRVLHPSHAALKARVESYQADHQPSFLKAARVQETQLNVVDVLVGYDLSARAWITANGKGSPDAFAARVVSEMNACLRNTGLNDDFGFRLAGTVLVDVDVSSQSLAFTLQNDLVTADGVAAHKSGEWAKVAAQREALGADVVTFWVDSPSSGNIGISYSLEDDPGSPYSSNPELIPTFGDWAYSVCGIGSVENEFVALHEIGHVMGCGHADKTQVNPAAIVPGPQLYTYSSGYHFAVGDARYNTIMAYSFDGWGNFYDYVPFFSSSSHFYKGVPVGDAIRDNTRTLRQTCSQVARYRVSKLSPDVPPTDVSWNVTFDARGGVASETVRAVADRGAVGALPGATHEGLLFSGWFTNVNGGQRISESTTVTGDVTYYAVWLQPNSYGIFFDPGTSDAEWSMGCQSVAVGAVEKLNRCALAPPSGKRFVGWRRLVDADRGIYRRYDDCVMVFNLADNPGETVILTALWE